MGQGPSPDLFAFSQHNLGNKMSEEIPDLVFDEDGSTMGAGKKDTESL